MIGGSSPGRGWQFFFSPPPKPALGPTQPLCARGMKLTTHLHLVPRSKNAWSHTSTPQYAFMAWFLVKIQGQIYLYLLHKHSISFPLKMVGDTKLSSSNVNSTYSNVLVICVSLKERESCSFYCKRRIQKFSDCRTALCHWVQLYRYFVSQSSEFCHHNPMCCFSRSVYCCKLTFRY
jgi:hypothetical protein